MFTGMQQQGSGIMPGMMMMGPQAMFQNNPGAGNAAGGGNPKADDKPQPKGISTVCKLAQVINEK